MAESILNVDEFVAPIAGENAAGEPVPFEIRNDLEEKRKVIDPDDYDPNDPARPTEAKYADWPGIIDVAGDTLRNKSKDLLVAARMTEALTQLHGFAGLADGLAVLRGLLTDCWDRCYPDISDGDLEVRAGPFNWLSDANRGSRFPNTVRGVSLVNGAGTPFSWQDWRAIQEGKGGSKEDFDKAVQAAPRETCQHTHEQLNRCIGELTAVSNALTTRMGPEAPAMTDLRAAVADCHTLSRMILERKGPAEDASTGATAGGGEAAAGGATAPMGSRDQIYRRLREAADALERLEPHSPIPYLLRRAVDLGAMPFPQLIRALLSDGGNLERITKEFGISDPEPTNQ